MITPGRPDDTDEQLAHTDGHPVTGADVRIVSERRHRLRARRSDGEVRVRGPMVPRATPTPTLDAEAFDDDGCFRTGDLGHLRADGTRAHRPAEGHHHPQGREHLRQGDRGPALRAPEGRRRRRHRPARPRAGRAGLRRGRDPRRRRPRASTRWSSVPRRGRADDAEDPGAARGHRRTAPQRDARKVLKYKLREMLAEQP